MTHDEGVASSRRVDARHLDFFDAAPDGIVLVDDAGLIVTINERAADMFGYSADEVAGHSIEILIPERFRESHVDSRKAYTARPSRRPMGATLSLFARRKSGEEFPVDVSLNSLRDPQGARLVIAFVRDVTTRRQMEDELRASELLVDNVTDYAIYMLDPSGRVTSWNQGAERIKGWSADEIVGRHFSIFYAPDDVASGQPERELERAAADGRAHSEGWRVRAGGQRFWAETTLAAVRHENGTLRGFAKVTRDRTESRLTRARLEAVADLNRAVLDGRPEDDLLALIAGRARAMVAATLVTIWIPDARTEALVAACAEGDGAARLVGTTTSRDSLVGLAMKGARAELVNDLAADARVPRELVDAGMGSGLFIPLSAAGDRFGVLGVMFARGREPLQPHEGDLLLAFGTHAAMSIAHGRARREVEQLHLVTERERIARDLHDSVIQRLFAVGLALEATGRRPVHEMSERLHRAVADIDDTIRAIRSSIFSLEARAEDAPSLRTRVLDVVAQESVALGFDPSVRFEGPVDTLTSDEVTTNLIATLSEALSNVARHAHATSATVTIAAGDDIVLTVEDDGSASSADGDLDFHREGGHGIANMRNRAQLLGGDASITAVAPHGARVEWRVPIGD